VFLIGIATSASILPAQDQKPANESAAPPALLLLVHQQAYPGKSAEREKLIAAESRISDRLDSAYYWIDLESITGDPESLLCFPFDSYNHMQQSNEEWKQLLTAHPEIDRMRGELESLIGSQRGIIAMRRDDLGYHADSIDLSEARYVNVLEVRLFPGRESDFADASKILVEAFDKIHAETAWVVYQVDAGTPSPTFLVFRPVAELKQNDEFLSYDADLAEAEGEQSVEALQRISRESYASTVKDIYAVHPQLSHVSKSFAAGDVDFWFHSPAPAPKPEAKADSKSSGKP
jgi:hypothetical protein